MRIQKTQVRPTRHHYVMYGISDGRPPYDLVTIAYQHASGTPRCMNSFDFVCIRARSAYRTVWCEPDTVSSWHPLLFDSSQPAIRSTRCSDIGRSKYSSRWPVSCDDAFPDSSRYAECVRLDRLIIAFKTALLKTLKSYYLPNFSLFYSERLKKFIHFL